MFAFPDGVADDPAALRRLNRETLQEFAFRLLGERKCLGEPFIDPKSGRRKKVILAALGRVAVDDPETAIKVAEGIQQRKMPFARALAVIHAVLRGDNHLDAPHPDRLARLVRSHVRRLRQQFDVEPQAIAEALERVAAELRNKAP